MCTCCKQAKDVDSFATRSASPDGRQNRCRECHAEYYQLRVKTNSEARLRIRARHYKRTYGVTPEWYDSTLAKQGDSCAICGSLNPKSRQGTENRFHIDHNHQTNQVRGLLCGSCNRGLGLFSENISTLESAILYLQHHA